MGSQALPSPARWRPRPVVVGVALCLTLTACGSTVQMSRSVLGTGGSTAGLDAPADATGTGAAAGSQSATQDQLSSLDGSGVAPGQSATTAAGSSGPGVAPGSSSAVTAGGSSSVVPVSGRGWDQRYVRIGVTTTSDIQTVGTSLGIHSINPGDLHADAEAMVSYLNAHGGLFGRQVKPEYFDVRTADNSESVGQQICTHFTQDVPVVALINLTTNGDTPAFDACIAKAHLPVMAWVTDTGDHSFFDAYHGFYNNMPFPSWERFARPFVQRLVAQRYFTGWDTSRGAPGVAPVKVGILEPDAPAGRQIAKLLVRELTAAGHAPDPGDVLFFSSEQDISGSELKFRTDNVTHVMGDELLFLFMESYESQHFRPRYGVNSANAPSLFLEGTVPAAQLVGSVGVGVTPTIDVFAGRDPGVAAVPGVRLCNDIYKQGHVSYPQDQRYAYTNMYGMCDGFRMILAAAEVARSLTGDGIRDGLGLVGKRVPTSLTFQNGFTAGERALPGVGRDLFYDTSCSCYRYGRGSYAL